MNRLKTTGIILRRIDYGEADRIITFLTSDYGKIRTMAKGVRKAKSKLAGGIELFSVSEIHFLKGRSEINTLVSTRLIKHYEQIVKDLKRTEVAYDMLKTIDKILEDHTGQDYFTVLHDSLAALNEPKISLILSELSFKMRVLQQLGQVPDFTIDSKGKPLQENEQYEFDFETVSFVIKAEGPYNKNHLKVLKLLAHNTPQAMSAVQGITEYLENIAVIVRGLFTFYVPI